MYTVKMLINKGLFYITKVLLSEFGGTMRRELSAPLWKTTIFPVKQLYRSALPVAAVSVPVRQIWKN